MCCYSIACHDCLHTWKDRSDSCPACRRINPIQLPLQIKGAQEIVQELRKIPTLAVDRDRPERAATVEANASLDSDILPDLS